MFNELLKNKKRFFYIILVSGAIFAFLMLIGGFAYYTQYNILSFDMINVFANIRFWFKNILVFIIVSFFIVLSFFLYSKLHNKSKTLKTNICYIILFFCLLFTYGLAYFAYFPGILGYDVYMQIPQALGYEMLTSHHPILHTMFIRICLYLGKCFSYPASGVVIYSIIQIVIFSLGITYVIFLVNKDNKKLISIVLSSLWFICYPVFALFSFNVTKDIFFATFFNIFVIKLYYIIRERDCATFDYLLCSFFALLSCMSRNNCVYVLICLLVVLLFSVKKKSVITMLGAVIIVYLFINIIIFGKIGNIKGPSQEKLSIPIQQMAAACVLSRNEISDEDYRIVEEYLPRIDLYNPSTVDYVKYFFNNEKYSVDKFSFWKTWIKIGYEHPITYFKSGLLLNLESWYPYYAYRDQNYYTQYINTNFEPQWLRSDIEINRLYKAPHIFGFYERFASFDFKIMEHKVLGIIFSMSFSFLYLFQMIVNVLIKRRYKVLFAFLPFIILWCTYLAGPLSNMRYFLPILVFIPFGVRIYLNEE